MLIEYLMSAVLLGIVVAVPPGSVTIIACQRALQYGFRDSVFFTLGSCLSDIFYITLVYIGVANLISSNQYLKIVLWVVCGIILIILGMSSISSLRKNHGIEENKSSFQSNPLATFISGILVTLSNPLTIVGWIVVAGNFYLIWNDKFPSSRNYGIVSVSFFMAGVLIWFVPLIFIVSKLKKRINDQLKKWLILFSDLCLIIFGFMALYYALKQFTISAEGEQGTLPIFLYQSMPATADNRVLEFITQSLRLSHILGWHWVRPFLPIISRIVL